MRVWDLTDSAELAKKFEPTAAEIFAVQGRKERRLFVCIAHQYETTPCELCDFRPQKPGACALCAFGRVLCRADDRSDERQVVFHLVEPNPWTR